MNQRAFTLIELLIVVAIIAILAAIAVPNFLEAMTRTKVSRVKADLRTISTAMESYHVDQNAYPYCDPKMDHAYLTDIAILTTPVAYIVGLPKDPFAVVGSSERKRRYRYYPSAYWVNVYPDLRLRGMRWVVMSNAPDLDIDIHESNAQDLIDGKYWMLYNPTNGTRSSGDVVYTNKGFLGNSL